MGTSNERTGPFWAAARGRAPLPRAAATLGFELIDADVDAGTIEVGFTASDDFTTPMGDVLGGFLAAMLYDTVGPCLLTTLAPDQFIDTLDLQTSFLRPAFPRCRHRARRGIAARPGRRDHRHRHRDHPGRHRRREQGTPRAVVAVSCFLTTCAARPLMMREQRWLSNAPVSGRPTARTVSRLG
jgi:acyl-coenzyme A thioesterase PaaI-like protein